MEGGWNINNWLPIILILVVLIVPSFYHDNNMAGHSGTPNIYADGVVTNREVLLQYGYPDKIDLIAPRCSTVYIEKWTYYGVREGDTYWDEIVWVFVGGRMQTKRATGRQINNEKEE